MKANCFFCDRELDVVVHTFKIGPKDEPVCDECFSKTENRRNAKATEGSEASG